MSLKKVVQALKLLPLGRVENPPASSDESDASEASDAKPDGEFFCIEDTFLSSEIKVSVNDVGPINFPIQEETIKKLIGISEKAKYGKGTETILDTSYRDTQTIPAAKLNVEIDEESLKNVLKRVEKELNIDEHSKLELHLYNLLIYGKGQFFKKHRDSEKIENMVATLVVVLPSAHTGGDLIIYHHGSRHKFFGSPNLKVIKCITFYADCYHEVEEVKDGYRVALTYNVALKSEPVAEGGSVNENLRLAVKNYFKTQGGADNLVYFLDHQYTEQSLRWHLLKGTDQTRAKALLAVAKKEGYGPCLALAEYREWWDIEWGDEGDAEGETELCFWIDENNQRFDIGRIYVKEDHICCTKETRKFEPYDREESGPTGNEGNTVEQWYRRGCVVLWKNSWSYLQGYKSELAALHNLTTQPDSQNTLLKKIKDNEKGFFNEKFWKDDDNVKKMIFDIVIFLDDAEMTENILKKFEPTNVLDLGKVEMAAWISNTWKIELWKNLVGDWKSSRYSEKLLSSLLPFLQQYMTKDDKNIEIAEYLLNEIGDIFMNARDYYWSGWGRSGSNDEKLCALLPICHKLGKLDLEEKLLKSVKSGEEAAHFKMFEKELHPEQFARISGKLLLNMTNSSLKKIEKEKYIYAEPKKTDIQNICSLLKNAVKVQNESVEEHILNHIMSDRAIYTASFLAELFVSMKKALGNRVNNYTQFKTHVLSLIDEQLGKLSNPNDWSLPVNHPCDCQFCKQVQAFLVSSTLTQVNIPTAEKNRKHIASYLNQMTYIPIKFETIRTGSPFKLQVVKLPKLQEDRQNLSKRLMISKKMIVDNAQGVSENSAAKKAKV